MQFSDTIACVLFELLVLELFIVFFQTRSRFHKFQYCSIFKVLCRPLSRTAHLFYHSEVLLSRTFLKFFRAVSRSGWPAVFVTAYLFYLAEVLLSRTFFEVFLSLSTSVSAGLCAGSEPPAIRSGSRNVRFSALQSAVSRATARL